MRDTKIQLNNKMKLTTKCALCNEMAEWSRNKKDRPTQYCINEWCLLFNKEYIIGQPLPKIIKLS